MEKITDEDLKAMLTKESPKEITNAETGEVQWTKITKEETKEAFNNLIDNVLDDNNTFEKPLQEQLEQEIDFNTIPENVANTYENLPLDPVLEKRHELSVGLTPENIQALYEYVGGKIEKPDFIDRFMSDADGRLREMSTIMAMMQLSRILHLAIMFFRYLSPPRRFIPLATGRKLPKRKIFIPDMYSSKLSSLVR